MERSPKRALSLEVELDTMYLSIVCIGPSMPVTDKLSHEDITSEKPVGRRS